MLLVAEETRQHVLIFQLAYSAGDTTVYLFTDATSHSVPLPCPHRFDTFAFYSAKHRRQ